MYHPAKKKPKLIKKQKQKRNKQKAPIKLQETCSLRTNPLEIHAQNPLEIHACAELTRDTAHNIMPKIENGRNNRAETTHANDKWSYSRRTLKENSNSKQATIRQNTIKTPTTNKEVSTFQRTERPVAISALTSRNVMGKIKHRTSRRKLLKRPRQQWRISTELSCKKKRGGQTPGWIKIPIRTRNASNNIGKRQQPTELENGCTNQPFNKSGLTCTQTINDAKSPNKAPRPQSPIPIERTWIIGQTCSEALEMIALLHTCHIFLRIIWS